MEFNWERLKPVFDGAPLAVFARDPQGRYLYVNGAFEAITGKRADEVLGRTAEEVLPADAAAAVTESDHQVIEQRVAVVFEALGTFGPGRRALMNFKLPLLGAGADAAPQAVFGFGIDVTERRRREEALQAAALAVSSAKGDAVFQELTRYLAVILNVDLALIGRLTESSPRAIGTLGVYGGGAYIENFEYETDIVPCGKVIDGSFTIVPRDVTREYPRDAMLAKMGAVGYAGFPLRDGEGKVAGVIAVVSRKPLVDQHL